MKTNKRFLLVASLALALAFTISCSDDEGSPSLLAACKVTKSGFHLYEIYGEYCTEYYGDDNKDWAIGNCEHEHGELVEECPKSSVKKCSENTNSSRNIEITTFYYDEKLRGMTCRELEDLDR
jgi:hypothetical protein